MHPSLGSTDPAFVCSAGHQWRHRWCCPVQCSVVRYSQACRASTWLVAFRPPNLLVSNQLSAAATNHPPHTAARFLGCAFGWMAHCDGCEVRAQCTPLPARQCLPPPWHSKNSQTAQALHSERLLGWGLPAERMASAVLMERQMRRMPLARPRTHSRA